jgi:hypothetical protein
MTNTVDENHIGHKAWRRLSPGQKRAIINDRKNARKIYDEFLKQRTNKSYQSKKES